ncbi:alpha-glucan family phosphorylase [Prosthecochloris sp. HL-130-GSB]|mgnify:CR=1 FL=1|jgi:glycogen phosphorylase|uniref:Alpha-glucan family phosphorylase n=1 Tax=Prosthecochloris aestuarii TaxID=1102 RepID=A0A831WW35_PROAE|nr:alpha-glucan family phosphorylase [Prosthecochloris sp. HL-130-GSB]ARM31856.1 alpha-glucan phosphorylase [Prosthecochloris sp. HL-130-GSB]MBO8093293.1 alpha-glucan family phosphorylase [Prosthecochloris sp.]HED31839.1 alpha-glucan family phosphorylase [Prosthecochloris aestuarii]
MRQYIAELKKLSHNLWWSWDTEAKELFKELSPLLWERVNHNPVELLRHISNDELMARLNCEFGEKLDRVIKRFEEYLGETSTWAQRNTPELVEKPVAYFSAEFGIHESVRIYSGGLGVLAGDHIKSASDLGINFIGISLFYKEGYFRQYLNQEGWQLEDYPMQYPESLPIEKVTDKNGQDLVISFNISQSEVYAQAWCLHVGRARLYLLDTNIPANESHYRNICGRVYGGDQNMRINQEILLGIGGAKLLKALEIEPAVYHMNEGHSAFLTIELLSDQLAAGTGFEEAVRNVSEQCVFTTHTPVPAGHDRFSRDMMHYSFDRYLQKNGIAFDDLMRLGVENPSDIGGLFTMTVLALNLSRKANGVSKLHGEVSRQMWHHLYPEKAVDDVPIEHVTNGIHIPSWGTGFTERFWSNYTDSLETMTSSPEEAAKVLAEVSDEELWCMRYRLKRNLIDFVYRYLSNQLFHQHVYATYIEEDSSRSTKNPLSPDVLTIGFARRFATYKRAPLIFRDIDRLTRIVNNPAMPVQIIFSGKAHPHDDAGKHFIRQIVENMRLPQFKGKIIFLENYNLGVAKRMISGVDVWLNNPLRPMEASGTSGQKTALHGGLNFSIPDGWWPEAFNGENGWSIGQGEQFDDYEEQDRHDAEEMYTTLENKIIPTYYERDENNIPVKWLKKVRNAITTIAPVYNTHRMVQEYATRFYLDRNS